MLAGSGGAAAQRALCAVSAAFMVRMALFHATPLSSSLGERIEFANSVTSFKRLVEGLFLYQRNVDPYDGGVNFHSPLLVLSFAAVPAGVFQTALFSLADCLIGWTIYGIARLQHVQNPLALLMWYLFNPINIASCVSMNTATFATLASVFALSAALESHAYVAIVWLVVATSLALWPVVLLIPLMMLNAKTDLRAQRPVVAFAKQTAAFVLALGAILVFFRYQFASWLYLRCYGAQLSLPDLSPNVGLWWYFFTEIFDSYRDFFLCVFTLHVIIYAAPITIRLSSDPLFSFVAVLGLTSVFKSYPTVGEHSVVLHLLFLFPDAFSRLQYTFLAVSIIFYSLFLGPAFHHLWLYAGSGNANFFYAITLVYNSGILMLLADFIHAKLCVEWDHYHPDQRGKEVIQI